jgi:hypothetical protein
MWQVGTVLSCSTTPRPPSARPIPLAASSPAWPCSPAAGPESLLLRPTSWPPGQPCGAGCCSDAQHTCTQTKHNTSRSFDSRWMVCPARSPFSLVSQVLDNKYLRQSRTLMSLQGCLCRLTPCASGSSATSQHRFHFYAIKTCHTMTMQAAGSTRQHKCTTRCSREAALPSR